MTPAKKVALVTGANSGVGFGLTTLLARRQWHVVLGCRNTSKAEAAMKEIRTNVPGCELSLLVIDVSSLSSVRKAAAEFQDRFDRLDCLFLNAGIFPTCGLNPTTILVNLYKEGPVEFFATGGHALKQPQGLVTKTGLGDVFAANVLGQYLLVDELQPVLSKTRPSRVIWTGSRASCDRYFSWDDIQHKNGPDAYGSSKYLIDLSTADMNARLKDSGVTVYNSCPGFVFTNIFAWLSFVIYPFFLLLQLVFDNVSLTPERGAEVLVSLAERDQKELDSSLKYVMRDRICRGRRRLATAHLGGEVTPTLASKLRSEFLSLLKAT